MSNYRELKLGRVRLCWINNWRALRQIGIGLFVRHGSQWRTRYLFVGRGCRPINFIGW